MKNPKQILFSNSSILIKLNVLLLLLFISVTVNAHTCYRVHKPSYNNFFYSSTELAQWNLIEDNSTGPFFLPANDMVIWKNAPGSFAKCIFSYNNNGSTQFLTSGSTSGDNVILLADSYSGDIDAPDSRKK